MARALPKRCVNSVEKSVVELSFQLMRHITLNW